MSFARLHRKKSGGTRVNGRNSAPNTTSDCARQRAEHSVTHGLRWIRMVLSLQSIRPTRSMIACLSRELRALVGCVSGSQVFPGVYRFQEWPLCFQPAVTNKAGWPDSRYLSEFMASLFPWTGASGHFARTIDIPIPADDMRLRNYNSEPKNVPYTTPNGLRLRLWQLSPKAAVAKDNELRIGNRDRRRQRAEGRWMRQSESAPRWIPERTILPESQIVNPMRPFSRKFQCAW